ncbi:MAG: PilZ domain-containing protein [Candidatus Acidiferrum sp.]
MGFVNESEFVTKMKHLRAGTRLNSRVPVGVAWSENGALRKAHGYTVDISPKGCMVVVEQGFAVGQKMQLTNLVNGRSTEATLVWRGHEGRTGWELGLELNGVEMEFWEVEF